MRDEQFAALYDDGIAVGSANIHDDSMTFRFRDEVFNFPLLRVHPIMKYNGYFYEAPVDALRKLGEGPPG